MIKIVEFCVLKFFTWRIKLFRHKEKFLWQKFVLWIACFSGITSRVSSAELEATYDMLLSQQQTTQNIFNTNYFMELYFLGGEIFFAIIVISLRKLEPEWTHKLCYPTPGKFQYIYIYNKNIKFHKVETHCTF